MCYLSVCMRVCVCACVHMCMHMHACTCVKEITLYMLATCLTQVTTMYANVGTIFSGLECLCCQYMYVFHTGGGLL